MPIVAPTFKGLFKLFPTFHNRFSNDCRLAWILSANCKSSILSISAANKPALAAPAEPIAVVATGTPLASAQ